MGRIVGSIRTAGSEWRRRQLAFGRVHPEPFSSPTLGHLGKHVLCSKDMLGAPVTGCTSARVLISFIGGDKLLYRMHVGSARAGMRTTCRKGAIYLAISEQVISHRSCTATCAMHVKLL